MISSSLSFTPSSIVSSDIDPDEPLLQQVTSVDSDRRNTAPGRYLVLADLNATYEYPCILDMKLGTRTYCIIFGTFFIIGDGAPPEKVERHIRVCKNTTSGPLGIRICGMRVEYETKF